ncbi:MAG TPA: lipopolysaccharide heptosyltransferase II [Nitrospira sp.]|nr:lipopolysaccharide heptosyltransferase II [Nitrospira sp.]
MPDYRRILFIKPSSLGDIVHAMPTFAVLRRLYPSAHLTWLVKREWAEVVDRIAGVDQVWPVERGARGWLSQVPSLRARRFDAAVDLQGLFRSAAMAWLSGAEERIGFANGREGSPWMYTTRVAVPAADLHAVDRYLLVAQAMGAPIERPEFAFRIPVSDDEEVDRLLSRHGMKRGDRWVAVNVSARWPTKRWPAASFATLADRLHQEAEIPMIFIGSPGERADVAAVIGSMRRPAVNLAGAMSVGLLPAFLRQAALLITNDSGPMHIAAAVETPIVALFGPTSPARTGPYGSGHSVLAHKIPCSPCFSRTCANSVPLACLTATTPTQVLDHIRHVQPRILERRS